MDEENEELEKARALVAKHEEEALRKCNEEMEQVLAKHGFRLTTNAQVLLIRNQ